MMTKTWLLIAALFMATLLASGARANNAPSAELEKAYSREYVYMASQKAALLEQKKTMDNKYQDRIAKAKAEVLKLQQSLARLTAANDERHELLTGLEKRRKELDRRGRSLEATAKKATQILHEFEYGLQFRSGKDSPFREPAADLKIADLGPLFAKARDQLSAASEQRPFRGAYLDENLNLREGEMLRLGRVAAFLNRNGQSLALGPDGLGAMKLLPQVKAGSVYIFDSLGEAAKVQHAASMMERLADFGPLVFLFLILLLVAGLFMAMVRI